MVGLLSLYCLTGEWSWFDAQSWQPEMTLGVVVQKWQKGPDDDESTRTLKPMGRVIWNRGYQWPHKMDLGPTKTLKELLSLEEEFALLHFLAYQEICYAVRSSWWGQLIWVQSHQDVLSTDFWALDLNTPFGCWFLEYLSNILVR